MKKFADFLKLNGLDVYSSLNARIKMAEILPAEWTKDSLFFFFFTFEVMAQFIFSQGDRDPISNK